MLLRDIHNKEDQKISREQKNSMDANNANENEVLCEKIISDIQAVFAKDPDLVAFEIIPTTLNRNKSPVIHVDHNLGLESWCVKHVYDHAHKMLLTPFRKHQQQRYLQQNETLVKFLNVALLINPDVTTFWHIRRQLVQKNHLKVHREFQFSALILTKKPKSNEAFAYRRWLYSFQSSESIDWLFEIGVCERCADRSCGNYHAWTHRQWVLQKAAPFLIRSEVMHSEKFMQRHISDYSSYHYRQFVLAKAIEMCFYDIKDLKHLTSLRQLINHYLLYDVRTTDEILTILLPGANLQALGEERLKSFLYCCNLAANDMKVCEDQKNLYGEHESFENHRRASLKFIVDQCIRMIVCEFDMCQVRHHQHTTRVSKYDRTTNTFLMALKRSESLLGEEQTRWCSIFLVVPNPKNSNLLNRSSCGHGWSPVKLEL